MSSYFLSNEVLENLRKILGDEYVEEVEEAVIYYIKMRSSSKGVVTNKKAMNKQLEQVRYHIQSIQSIISDKDITRYLMEVAELKKPDQGGKHLIGTPPVCLGNPATLKEMEQLIILDELCEAAIMSQKSGAGRPTGSDSVAYRFVEKLYVCCEKSNDGPIPLSDRTILHEVVYALYKPQGPLEGDTLRGVIKKVIKQKRGL